MGVIEWTDGQLSLSIHIMIENRPKLKQNKPPQPEQQPEQRENREEFSQRLQLSKVRFGLGVKPLSAEEVKRIKREEGF